MPIVDIKLIEGRTLDQKRKLVAAVTDAIVESIGVRPDTVRIVIHDMAKEDYAIAGILIRDEKR